MNNREQAFLDSGMSVYLDAIRFLAAMSVVIGHMDEDGLYAAWMPLASYGHEAVVVFFVLSGLVIGHSTECPRTTWDRYVIARASRILSVVVPAIALSFLVKGLAAHLDGGALRAEFFAQDMRAINLFGSLFFLNESWSIDGDLPWNGPFWSLCYEVWYYVMFGLLVFAPSRTGRWLIVLAGVVAGPAIVLLFPIWLLGRTLARHGHRVRLPVAAALVLWPLSWAVIVAIDSSGIDVAIRGALHASVPGYWRLESAQRFITDGAMALAVAVNFLASRALLPWFARAVDACRQVVVFLASFTFSLYLYHRPLTKFIGHFQPNREHDPVHSITALAIVLGICFALGMVTERRRDVVRRWVGAALRGTFSGARIARGTGSSGPH